MRILSFICAGILSVTSIVAGAVTATVSVDVVPGVNFKSLEISGTVCDWIGEASGQTNVCVVVTSESTGATVKQEVEYIPASAASGSFKASFGGVQPGATYVVSAYVCIGGTKTDAESSPAHVVAARTVDGWILENARTFAGSDPGTGTWVGTNGVAEVTDSLIAFTACDWDSAVEFHPTVDTPAVRSSRVKDLHYKVVFSCPGLFTCEAFPIVSEEWIAAITLIADEEDNCRFAVVSNGVWTCLDGADMPTPTTGEAYEILIRAECGARTNVTYYIVNDGQPSLLASTAFDEAPEKWMLPISGVGFVSEVRGLSQDENLLLVGNYEFTDLDAALGVAGETMDVEPLWNSQLAVSGRQGTFRIVDNGLLNLIWKKWHHYLAETDGDVLVYRYLSGNNWIEYADVAGVETNEPGVVVVHTPEGLAWISESATNEWFAGKVVLGDDIDLTGMNWTPIARFTGLFDGNGRTITGLNNTNEVAELGEAGVYRVGTANAWGRTAYGLFGTATNATFRNVGLSGVAIESEADSVAALLGVHAGGDLAVLNVTNASGYVCGAGRAVAGLLTVGVTNGPVIGSVLVTGNVNRASIIGSVAADSDGGNVAQILAGAEWDTLFAGDVVATNNVGEGAFDVQVADGAAATDWYESYFSWFDLPVCNFAAAVMRFTENEDFARFVEANSPASIPIDPAYRTARMLYGSFANGADNIAGWWTDSLSAIPEGGVLKISGTGNTLDVWDTVVIDRDVTIDLNTNCVYGLYDCDVFVVADGKTLTLKNGILYYAHGYSPTSGTVSMVDVKMAEIPGETFYDRTVPVQGLEVTGGNVTIVVNNTSQYFYYIVDSTPNLANDWTQQDYQPGNGSTITFTIPADSASGFYRVRISDVEPTEE